MTPEQRSLRDALAAVPDRFAAAAVAAPPPPDGEWTSRLVVLHLLAVEEQVWHTRLRQLATEREPRWPWIEPGLASFPGDDTLAAALAAYAAARRETVAQLDALDDAGWARSGTHATYGVLDVAALLRRAIDHDEEHLASLGG